MDDATNNLYILIRNDEILSDTLTETLTISYDINTHISFLGDTLKDWFELTIEEAPIYLHLSLLFTTFISIGLSQIDWTDLARGLVPHIREQYRHSGQPDPFPGLVLRDE